MDVSGALKLGALLRSLLSKVLVMISGLSCGPFGNSQISSLKTVPSRVALPKAR